MTISTKDTIAAKVRKLLKLAGNNANAAEAALAAAKAQQLIDAYQLADMLLTLDATEQAEPDEAFVDFSQHGAPLDAEDGSARWRGVLAVLLSEANGAQVYRHGVRHARRLDVLGDEDRAALRRIRVHRRKG